MLLYDYMKFFRDGKDLEDTKTEETQSDDPFAEFFTEIDEDYIIPIGKEKVKLCCC